MRTHRGATGLAALALVLTAGSASGSKTASGDGARALAVRIVLPGQEPTTLGDAEAPPGGTLAYATLVYPGDGTVVSTGPVTEEALVKTGSGTSAAADIARLGLFGGELTADAVAVRAQASVSPAGATGDTDGSGVTNLVVLGQPVQVTPGASVQLGDWGHAVLLRQTAERTGGGTPSFRSSVTAIDVVLDAAHGGLPAGTRILVGYAAAWSEVTVTQQAGEEKAKPSRPPPAIIPTKPSTQKSPRAAAPKLGSRPPRSVPSEPKRRKKGRRALPTLPPPNFLPKLGPGGYVFPVYGPAGYSDTFGVPRADVAYHHGDDIFAPLGAPVLAVADGTVFSVGWEKLGGNRLWLRDRQGNEFYYAHLAAYSTLAANGAQVHAGDVIGFVGNTGDAEATPYHLHFEVHPVQLLFLGEDSAVDPTSYLDSFRRLQEVRLRPAVGGGPAFAAISHAPPPGAILLESSDISTADGLEPGSLQRALAKPPPGYAALAASALGG